jgi:hypothetical protein
MIFFLLGELHKLRLWEVRVLRKVSGLKVAELGGTRRVREKSL